VNGGKVRLGVTRPDRGENGIFSGEQLGDVAREPLVH